MKATQYFAGFGPTVWSSRRGETEYGLKAIPAGGFVKIVGMTPLEEVAPEDRTGRSGVPALAAHGRARRRVGDPLRARPADLLRRGVPTGLPNPAAQSFEPLDAPTGGRSGLRLRHPGFDLTRTRPAGLPCR
jgi:membrane-associated protease RseP (regulator of RpoE activity)